MQQSLVSHRALVTGAARGIGRAIAAGLAESGVNVILHDRPESPLLAAAEAEMRTFGGEVHTIAADLEDPAQCDRLATEAMALAGRIDILVLNASMEVRGDWRATPPVSMDQQFAVNLRSSLLLLQRLVPPMLERGFGRVLSIGSIQEEVPNPDFMVYAACKAAQANVMRSLAREHGAAGVTFNTLAPGAIETERNAAALADSAHRSRIAAKIPAGRLGDVADCVPAALLLCSEAAGYINGATVRVDGGWSA
ncbi:SDR family NAD(P)-dependent oxidoreductase [Neorhizobium sp. DT-125]|uniref:SDR family NAD(P)-dependent oxidoreductase n=1 Tax=Neorhizobium sp. DT-125 TaxID=3396163 RepID=UPI003F1E347E